MLLTEGLAEFLLDCEVRNYSKKTIKGFRNNIELLICFLDKNFHINMVESVSTNHIKNFLLTMQRAKRKPSYINGLNKTYRSWFKYLLGEGYIKTNPMENTLWAREEKVIIQTFSTEEMKRMVKAYTETSYMSMRNKAIICLLFDTGIRCSELCDLTFHRQLGITTLSCAYSIYLAMTNSNTTCLLVSYSIDSATAIFEKLKQLYNDLPDVLSVSLALNNKKELKFQNGSRIICATCGSKDVARGLTIRFCHLSEIGFMKDTVDKQLLAIEQALTPNGKIILESTANGLNYFSELYQKAERQESLYKPFFFSWIDDKVMFAEEYKMFCDRYISIHGALPTEDDLTDTERSLMEQGASLEQLVWRRLKIANSSEESFAQEFPCNPIEAFVTSGSNIFTPSLIHERLQYIHTVKSIISKQKNMPISLFPWLRCELTIWDVPRKGHRYYIGVDTGEGMGQDFSAIQVLSDEGVQVAEFKSNKIKPFQFAEVVKDIAIYYNRALLVIEKASAGHTVVDKLKNEYKYPNLYKYKEYDARGNIKKKAGFITNSKTKPLMINDFVELFETSQLIINSKDLLSEMKIFQFRDGKMEAIVGKHDDLVMAFALAIVGMKSGLNYI